MNSYILALLLQFGNILLNSLLLSLQCSIVLLLLSLQIEEKREEIQSLPWELQRPTTISKRRGSTCLNRRLSWLHKVALTDDAFKIFQGHLHASIFLFNGRQLVQHGLGDLHIHVTCSQCAGGKQTET